MKKRMICLVLSLVMLISLIPAAAITASAAGATATSAAGIRVIKDYMGFEKNAYQVAEGVYRIGYGTPSVAGATITEANADLALREKLSELEAVVRGVSTSLVQKRFDALVWYSYVEGTGWTGSAAFVGAVQNGTTGSAFADIMGSWDYDVTGYTPSPASGAVLNRRLAMINLYLNGVYSTSPGPYSFTLFGTGDAAAFSNGAKWMVQLYDTRSMTQINVPTPVMANAKFLGWYIESAMITSVGSSTAGKNLMAHWQAGDNKVAAKYTLPGYVIYEATHTGDSAYVNVYSQPTTASQKIDVVQRDAVVTIAAELIDAAGAKWLELATGGWVKLCDSLSSVPSIISGRVVTITDDYVNIRTDPNAMAGKVAQAKRGETRTIYMLSNDNKWGYCSQGWLFLAYTDYGGASGGTSASQGQGIAGTVTGAQKVNVRTGAGVGNTLATQLPEGTAVKVYEQTTVDGATWGRIDQGWISMGYVKLSQTAQTGLNVSAGSSAVVSSSTSLNVRSGPGTGYSRVGALTPGTSVVIYEKRIVNGVAWGHIDQGWINLNYVTAGVTSSGAGGTTSGYGVGGTVVNCSTGVNIRSAAGTANALVGVAPLGSRVTVTERTQVNGFYWGHIDRGWVCMDYIKLDQEFVEPSNNNQSLDNVVTSFEGYPAKTKGSINVRESASADSKVLLTLKADQTINILARAQSGVNQYGKVTIGNITGWINMNDVTMNPFHAKVTAAKADTYEMPSVRSKFFASLVKGTYVEVVDQQLSDGVLWGKIELKSQNDQNTYAAWIKLSDVTQFRDNQAPTGVTTLSGVGYLTGYVTGATPLYKDSNGNVYKNSDGNLVVEESIYSVVSGHRVNIQARNYVDGVTYGKITVGSVTGWIPMSSVALDPVPMQATANLPAWTSAPVSTQGAAATIPAGSAITVVNRLIVADTNEINHGIADFGEIYWGDDLGTHYWIRLDQGGLKNVTAAANANTGNPVIAVGLVVTGTTLDTLNVYEEALDTSAVLLQINPKSNVTILNWRLVDGKTWGKVQIGNIVGWVDVSDVSKVTFEGLKGAVAVNELKLYSSPNKSSEVQILHANNQVVDIENNSVTFDGAIVWGRVTIANAYTGWVDLADVRLNTPGADYVASTVIATGTVNSVNATNTVDGNVVQALPKGTAVSLTGVTIDTANNKAIWNLSIGGTIDMDYLKMNTAIATVATPSAVIFNDLESMATLYTLYRDETITVLTFKCWNGALYGEVAYGDTTGWILLCDDSNKMQVSLRPGSTGTNVGPANPANPANPTNPTDPTAPSTAPIPGYIVCSNTVNVRNGAGVHNTLVTTLPNGKTVNIYEQTTVLGKGWARIDEGWVCMDYVRLGTLAAGGAGTGAGTGTNTGAPVIVTTVPSGAIAVGYANEDVKIRSGSGLGYPEVATVKKGNSVTIYEKKLDGGMSWGRTDNGWICISYLTITGIGASGSGNSGSIARCGFTANVRSNANSGSALMARVMISSRVVVHETMVVGNETWGRTDLGWISMQYIVMDNETAPVPTPTDPGATTATDPSNVTDTSTDGFVG